MFPAAALTGLTPRQIEFILAHELAHVRRHDYLVNLLQSATEAILFYHPLVWWVSRRIRIEREHCCDDKAVEACGDRAAYATALADLEELRASMIRLSVAACGTALLPRVRRLLQPASPDRGRSWAGGATAGALVVLLASVCVARGAHRLVEPRPPVPIFTEGTFGGNTLELVTVREHVTAEPNFPDTPELSVPVIPLAFPRSITEQIAKDAGY